MLFLLLVLCCFSVQAQQAPIIKNHLAFSYDDLLLPNNESMGLIGGNYLFGLNSNFYTGLGVYGAVKGKRGGFFTGGLDVGWRYFFFRNYFIDLNGFVGGGGGGSAPQGGGLMLRSAFDAGIKLKQSSIGIGYSYIEFPNGDISSHQFSIHYRYSFESFHFSGWSSNKSNDAQWLKILSKRSLINPSQFSLQLTHYFPHDSVKVSGKKFDKRLDILGIRWRNKLNSKLWLEFETGGAMLGNIDGFAQVFSGISYENQLGKNVYGNLGMLIGAAGGGDVNTGGGLVYRTFAGLGYRLNIHWSIASQIAWTSALEGDFKAKTALLNIVYHYKSFIPTSNLIKSTLSKVRSDMRWRRYRIRPGVQRYSHYYGSGRKNDSLKNQDVNLVNLKLDSFINSHFYVTGHALGAFGGEAGGYAVGLVGPGIQINPFLSAELLGGVAGGGGIAVGSGQIAQPMLNISWPLSDQWGIEGSAGYIFAVNDKLSALVTNIGAIYRFRSPFI